MVTLKNFVTVVWSRRERTKEGVQCFCVAPYMDLPGNAVGSLQIGFLFRIDIDVVWKGHRFSQPDKPGKLLGIMLTFNVVGHYVDLLQICMVKYGETLS